MGTLVDAGACEAADLLLLLLVFHYCATVAATCSLTRFAAHKRHYTSLPVFLHGPHKKRRQPGA